MAAIHLGTTVNVNRKKMSRVLYVLFFVSIVACVPLINQRSKSESIQENQWLWKWISSWENISKATFNLSEAELPEMIFFDSIFVYSNSRTSIPKGITFNGPELYSKKIEWRKQEHNGEVILPDSTPVNVQLMTFAAPKNNGAYFVMPALSYWEHVGLKNEIVPIDVMINGIFVHEFAHTSQINAIAAKIIALEGKRKYKYPVNDDIIQNYFKDDSIYTMKFNEEVEELFELLGISEKSDFKIKTKQWLEKFRMRQKEYFNEISPDLVEMEDLFLTMEGIGQYAMFKFYMSEEGGKYSDRLALKATRYNKKFWSQEEGLGLILLYEKLIGEIEWSKIFSLCEDTIID